MVVLLFALRLISAGLLIAFVAVLFYMMMRDMRIAQQSMVADGQDMGRLTVTDTESEPLEVGAQFNLRSITTIGRGDGNVIVLPDTFASSEHALITKRGPRWWIEDLGSSNGTLLNDEPLSGPTVVASGDIVMIGSTQLRIDLEPATILTDGKRKPLPA